MDGSFTVHTGEVRSHAATVSAIATQVSSASGAAQSSVHGNAYGAIGQFFAAAMMLAGDQAREGIMKGAQSFMDVSAGLRSVAALYQQVDEAHAQLLSLTKGEVKKP
ncbi:MAG: type VII secretion target [Labedaea sp.]